MARSGQRKRDDVKWGLSRGLGIGLIYTGWALVTYLVRGDRPFTHFGVTVWEMIGTYIGLGALCGIIIGALRPLTQHTFGAYSLGLLAGAPIGTALILSVKGPPGGWTDEVWTGLPVFCVLIGLLLGRELRRSAKEGSTRATN